MQEQNGVAYCASTFSKEGSPPRTVFAAPAYVPVTMSDDDLSLQRLYDHPDFIDLISAQEFGLEQTGHGKLLLCVVVAAAPGALRELMGMITSDVTLLPCAQCRECDNSLRLSIGDAPVRHQSHHRRARPSWTGHRSHSQEPLPRNRPDHGLQ